MNRNGLIIHFANPFQRDIEIEHWGDSDFNNWLSEPRFSGKLYYFFRKLELDPAWLRGNLTNRWLV